MFTAKVLLVAERKNPRLTHRDVLDSMSGRFLRTCLNKRWEIVMVNAYGDDAPDDDMLVSLSTGRAAIALGIHACRRLCQLEILHTVVPHPQWARRFGGPRDVSKRWYTMLLNLAVAHGCHP